MSLAHDHGGSAAASRARLASSAATDGVRPPANGSGTARLARSVVRLLDVDTGFAEALSEPQLLQARRYVIAEPCALAPGIHDPQTVMTDKLFGVLILDGLLIRRVAVGGRFCGELIGPGALLTAPDDPGATASLPSQVSWRVLTGTQLALLDQRFLAAVSHWPTLAAAVTQRIGERNHALGVNLTIHSMQRVEFKVLALMWHLADQFGKVTPHGIALALPLSHSDIAELAGTARPTASLALGKLAKRGQLIRQPNREGWLLPNPVPEQFSNRGSWAAETEAVLDGAGALD